MMFSNEIKTKLNLPRPQNVDELVHDGFNCAPINPWIGF